MSSIIYVYMLEHISNGNRYVGKTFDIEGRLIDHIRTLKTNSKISIAIREFGFEKFLSYILFETTDVTNAARVESLMITYNKCEYNIKTGRGRGANRRPLPPLSVEEESFCAEIMQNKREYTLRDIPIGSTTTASRRVLDTFTGIVYPTLKAASATAGFSPSKVAHYANCGYRYQEISKDPA